MVLHHRSASDDAEHHQQLISDEVRHSYHTPPPWTGRDLPRTTRGHQRAAAAVFRRDTMPPIHLMSATNEVRSGLVHPQQLPLKLASSSDPAAARRPRWASGSPAAVPSSRSEHPPEPQPVDEDRGQVDRVAPDQQLWVGEVDGIGHGDRCGSRRPAAVSPTSTGLRQGSTGTSSSTTSRHPPPAATSPSPGATSAALMSKSSPTASSILPMKLAERPRPKSATSPTIQTTSTSSAPPSTRTTAGLKSHVQPSKTSDTSVMSSVQSGTPPVDEQLTRRTPPMDSYSSKNSTESAVSNRTSAQRSRQIIYF